ncbi:hypothetical protein BGHDH14_bgh02382 [Blumeria hordei DH14]|uniref:Uncharacterized protein n=1 Tax=Blumeria graminis f. sp. hordei (strain DH14) TaxID=546991 RepID=N1JGL1_BLUG1|nr:hypothetical protein BGHDH14_bgh02382 [Blumeria hordei DH14]
MPLTSIHNSTARLMVDFGSIRIYIIYHYTKQPWHHVDASASYASGRAFMQRGSCGPEYSNALSIRVTWTTLVLQVMTRFVDEAAAKSQRAVHLPTQALPIRSFDSCNANMQVAVHAGRIPLVCFEQWSRRAWLGQQVGKVALWIMRVERGCRSCLAASAVDSGKRGSTRRLLHSTIRRYADDYRHEEVKLCREQSGTLAFSCPTCARSVDPGNVKILKGRSRPHEQGWKCKIGVAERLPEPVWRTKSRGLSVMSFVKIRRSPYSPQYCC